MTEEEIIRNEAKHFFEKEYYTFPESGQSINGFLVKFSPRLFKEQVENRLKDFFSPKSKAYFLDEVKRLLEDDHIELIETPYYDHDDRKHYLASIYYVQQFIDELPALVTSIHQVNTDNTRDSIFISYSHQDKSYVDSFKRHFANLIRTHNLDLWDDSKIKPGQKWEEEIKKAMQKAKVAIFVTSADFFASDFIANKELPELLRAAEEEGAKVLSIIVKPCDFSNTPLGIYQAMNNPTHTLLHMNELQREELWVNLVSEVRKIMEL